MDALDFLQCYYAMCYHRHSQNGCGDCEAQEIDCELTTDYPEKLVEAVEMIASTRCAQRLITRRRRSQAKLPSRSGRARICFSRRSRMPVYPLMGFQMRVRFRSINIMIAASLQIACVANARTGLRG